MCSWDVEDAGLIPLACELMPFPSAQENKVHLNCRQSRQVESSSCAFVQVFKFAVYCFTHLANVQKPPPKATYAPAWHCAGWCRQGQEGPAQVTYGASSFSVTGHCISGFWSIVGFTFLNVVFKMLITATNNNIWLRFELADLSLNHQISVGFPLWNEQPASSHWTGTHTPLKHLLLDKLSSLSSLRSHWKLSSPAFLTSYHVSRCNNTRVASTESGSNPEIWGWDFQMSLTNLSGLNLI